MIGREPAFAAIGPALLLVCAAQVRAGAAEEGSRIATLKSELAAARLERDQVERELAVARRRFPPDFERAEEEDRLRRLARSAGIETIEIPEPSAGEPAAGAPDGAGAVELHRVAVSGRAPFADVDLLLALLSGHPRVMVVDSLELTAAGEGAVEFVARLLLPTAPGVELAPGPTVTPPPEERDGSARERAIEDRIAALLVAERAGVERDLAALRSTREELAGLTERSGRRPELAALARFRVGMGGEAIALERAEVAGATVLEGVVLGAAARARLRPALEAAGFGILDLREGWRGECRSFSVRAVVEPDRERIDERTNGSAGAMFSDRIEPTCVPGPETIRGAVAAADGRGGAGSSFHVLLREAEAVDLFRALHEALGISFVVGPGVVGRLSAELDERTSFEQLSAAGLAVGEGPLHRVSADGVRHAAVAPPATGWSGEPARVSIRRAELSELLCLLDAVLPGSISTSSSERVEVGVFATEIPLDQLLETVVAAAGWSARRDGEGWSVGPAPSAAGGAGGLPRDPCERVATGAEGDWARAAVELERLGVEDLRLTGLIRAGESWRALVDGPARSSHLLEVGSRLFDARVVAIDASGVRLENDAGRSAGLPW